jgi:hypothetical protein
MRKIGRFWKRGIRVRGLPGIDVEDGKEGGKRLLFKK